MSGHPDQTGAAARVARLTPQQRELLLRRLRESAPEVASVESIPRRSDPGAAVALSPAQRRLWFFERLQPGTGAYNLYAHTRLRGPLDVDAVRASIVELAARHDALRMVFSEESGEPRLRVLDSVEIRIAETDLSDQPAPAREQVLAKLLETETAFAFDLSRALFRAGLVKLADDDHALTLVVHHIVSDAWSCGRLLEEFSALYRARTGGVRTNLPALPVTYADAVAWQAERAAGDGFTASLHFWKEALDGTTGILDMPTDRPRAPTATGQGARLRFGLDATVRRRMAELAVTERATPFMAWLALFQMLLARQCGQDDVVVGTPVANRGRPELEPLVGLFVNTLPLRGRFEDDPSFRTVLARTRSHCMDALENAEVPLERIVDALRVERVPGRSPLVQTMFLMQDSGAPMDLPGIEAEWLEPELRTARFEVTLSLTDTAAGFDAVFDYATDLFDAATMVRFARQLQTLAQDALDRPDTTMSRLQLLDGEAVAEILYLGDGGPATGEMRGLFDLVAAQADRTPDAIALADGTRELSYASMVSQVHVLAARLQAAGVVRGDRVAILADRSIEAVLAVLAILAAGGAYIPVDPGQPDDRVRYVLSDADVSVLIAPPSMQAHAMAFRSHVAVVDSTGPSGAVPFEPVDVALSDAAYVIYTSGSTGTPKGVVIEHASAANLVAGFLAHHEFAGKRLLMIPPLIFDASVGDLFPVLACGATLVLHPDPAMLGARELREFCKALAINAIDAPAALWRRWVEAGAFDPDAAGDAPYIELMMIGGESVPQALARHFVKASGGRATLVNHYGPTEASVCATIHAIRAGDTDEAHELPIGRPLPGVGVYIVDRNGSLAPRGVLGELCIGGAGVARGYLGQPELTRERFIPDPFASIGDARLYKTGDLARWDSAGRLQFAGRSDHQAKLRGLRVELGEIEAALASHPGVSAAVALVREDRPGDRRLVAYIVGDARADDTSLRANLAAHLPEALLPSAYVLLGALPLTPNGKVDRKALPAPASIDTGRSLRAPSTPTEAAVLAVWQEVLGRAAIGVDDDFFAAGGDSLLTLPLVFGLHTALGVDVPLSAVFATPTIAGLARDIDARREGTAPPVLDLSSLVVLPDTIHAAHAQPARADRGSPRSALVTGATGFLGAYLVRELLDSTDAEVVCLVRASNAVDGVARIRSNLAAYGLWNDSDAARLIAICGDLAEPSLGLQPVEFDDLGQRLDVIFHNGGQVNFLAPYQHLQAANVAGTREVLRLATTGPLKPVHLVSTLGVYLTDEYLEREVHEDDAPPGPDGQHGGYNQSKWVSEQLALLARERGVPVAVYRPARITADSRTGASNVGDYFNAWLKGCVQLGIAPDLPDEAFDMAPVDYVGRAIVRLALGGGDANGNFHFFNNHRLPIRDAIAVLRAEGFAITEVPYPQWRAALLEAASKSGENALAPFAGLFPERPDAREPHFDCTRTEQAAQAQGLAMPPADRALFATGVRFLKVRGAMPAIDRVEA